jgi:hypothetical protein
LTHYRTKKVYFTIKTKIKSSSKNVLIFGRKYEGSSGKLMLFKQNKITGRLDETNSLTINKFVTPNNNMTSGFELNPVSK